MPLQLSSHLIVKGDKVSVTVYVTSWQPDPSPRYNIGPGLIQARLLPSRARARIATGIMLRPRNNPRILAQNLWHLPRNLQLFQPRHNSAIHILPLSPLLPSPYSIFSVANLVLVGLCHHEVKQGNFYFTKDKF